jgi:hypothetical protein
VLPFPNAGDPNSNDSHCWKAPLGAAIVPSKDLNIGFSVVVLVDIRSVGCGFPTFG